MYSGEQHKKKIAEIFLESFTKKDTKLALYGTGINTEEILRRAQGYSIVGLMDAKKEGEILYGYPVLTEEEVIGRVEEIVIIAREEVLPIIYQRISHLIQHGIRICNIRHEDLSGSNLSAYRDYPYWKQTKGSLMNEIKEHEIITFDVFDTLLVRKVQRPEDIFHIVEKKLAETEYKCPFVQMRQQAAQAAYKKYIYPTYNDIYQQMKEQFDLSETAVVFLAQMELDTEKDFITVRKTIVEMIEYAKSLGKKVFLLSDMYLGKKEISFLLESFRIVGIDDIFVSSDIKASKWPEGTIYQWLRKTFGESQSYLHIGDSPGADIEKAKEHGLDVFYIMSAYDMMVHSAASRLLVHVHTLTDSIVIGMMCSHFFNDPFVLSQTSGDLFLENNYEYGYLAFGPLVAGMVKWMHHKLEYKENVHIWFLARDGYIFEKVYQIYKNYIKKKLPKADYVLASRRSVSVAALYNWDDIQNSLIFVPKDLSNEEMLRKRFGLTRSLDNEMQQLSREEVLKRFQKEILKNAEQERERYRNYLQNFYCESENLVMFDLVTSGTIPYALEKLLGRQMDLYCISGLLVSDYSVLDQLKNQSAYLGYDLKYLTAFQVASRLGEVEGICTSESPMFLYIGEDGQPVFWQEEESQQNRSWLQAVHKGIMDFADQFYSLGRDFDLGDLTAQLADDCFGVFTDDCVFDKKGVRTQFHVTDYFCKKEK